MLCASLLLVTFWWAHDGGVQDLGTLAGAMMSIGRLSGLVASVLLLAQVVLMTRVPALERAFGQDELARLHRLVGFTSFTLMLVHVLTITDGYAAARLSATPATFWDLTVHYSGMLLGVVGTACLVMVVVTSIKAARRRLRYESWHLLHLYGYLGVGLALPHQLWTGQEFTDSPGKTLFWWTAWGVVAGVVLTWRVGVPVWRNLRHRLVVDGVVTEAPGVWSVHVTGRHLGDLDVRAGQFFTWRFLDGAGWTRGNPYSLSAEPDGRRLRITVADAGDGSRRVAGLRPGTRVLVEGPYGRLSSRARTAPKVAFIGAGVGITPLRSLAGELPYAAGDAFYLERFTSTALFTDEVDALATSRGLAVLRLPGRRRAPDSWLGEGIPADVDDLAALRHWLPDVAERDVYLCGPRPWTDLVRTTLARAGLPDERLHLESFAW
ncbi:oxidoreductase [Nocardioides marmorisolisilvae]|uniref:Oxidoreductase n=1 Tax=Nocardioides marmorisolisilvae TaxID=1542737 RepID=A0A3N0DQ90_9ACTN|nr:oxidoreductase [Nocardioides marmorisolisilvae]